MKYLLLIPTLLLSWHSFADDVSGAAELNLNYIDGEEELRDGRLEQTMMSIDIKVEQSFNDLDENEIEEVLVTALRTIKSSENGHYKSDYFSYKRTVFHAGEDDIYTNAQLQLADWEIAKIVKFENSFILTMKANIGFGWSHRSMVDEDKLIMSESEIDFIRNSYGCNECTREGTDQSGSVVWDAGFSVTVSKDNSYISLKGDAHHSGNFRELIDQDKEEYKYGYQYIPAWERRTIYRLGLEAGHTFNVGNSNTPLTVYGRVNETFFNSTAKIHEQGDGKFNSSKIKFDRGRQEHSDFEIGVRVPISIK